jgi:hypothetical protein
VIIGSHIVLLRHSLSHLAKNRHEGVELKGVLPVYCAAVRLIGGRRIGLSGPKSILDHCLLIILEDLEA